MVKILFILSLGLLAGLGCTEKKSRIWIEPPPGYGANERQGRKLYYQVEDLHSGKKENLIIPIDQTSENLIVENHKPRSEKGNPEFALATTADQFIQDGKTFEKVLKNPAKNSPRLSYLLGMEAIEDLYQKRKFSEALVQIAPLIEQYPKQVRLFMMQGTLFRKIGEKKLAFRAYQEAQKIESSNPEIEEAVLRLQDELGDNI